MYKIENLKLIPLTDKLIDWLNNGDRDVSTDTIVSTLTNVKITTLGWHPHYHSSIGKIIKLMEAEPLIKEKFSFMKFVNTEWKLISENFDLIQKHYEECMDNTGLFDMHIENFLLTKNINDLK